ncbi:zf-MYND domain-containing protein/PDCD2_C domain-containing protein [Cephalotus follicularis]|uniref:Zf-MYND domain-containing protein/PDCD2_C domain-containing protein n=1 Tax=Cephalotus follicularis TaxID=3775 RepID=A0A1Q3AML3_CEPFO|nr:zf-MYND domain-containing protein/PDCD2_C domain-containing protein [Cephalotus follicularis]
MDADTNGDSVENLRDLRLSSLDDDEDGEEEFVVDSDDDYDEDGDKEKKEEPVTLGFVEKPKNHWSLLRQFFPNKAGGIPAWLDPVNLPSQNSSLCDFCGEPLQFLLQVYAPPMLEKESAYHRTLFVFMCPSMSCLFRDQHEQWRRPPEKPSRSVKVFRCQLPRSNTFYSSEDPNDDGTAKSSGAGAPLCNWCGTWKGGKVCSSCKRAHYCSQKHQVMHWRSGHKIECQQLNTISQSFDSNPCNGDIILTEVQKVASNTLWPEYEITYDDDSEYQTKMSEEVGHANSLISKDRMCDTTNSILGNFEGDDEKKSMASFQEHIAKAPEQVLRYPRNVKTTPLWPMSSGRPSKADIPKCSYCSGPLRFEFQILPQLLYYFGVKNDVDSLDWATIAVFTCEASCETSVSYIEEFTWVQLYSTSA